MSKNVFFGLAKAAAVAALFVPFRYEKTEDGFTVSSVLVKVQYKNGLTPAERAEAPEDSTGKTIISIPGILDEQIETVKTLWAKGSAYAAEKREEMLRAAMDRHDETADIVVKTDENVENAAGEASETDVEPAADAQDAL